MDEYESTADLNEAWDQDRMEADIEMAEMIREGNRLAALRRQGICTHSSAVGVSATGEIIYPEQEGLEPGQLRCTAGCGTVFESDDAWFASLASL
jgi:hypothetical protein